MKLLKVAVKSTLRFQVASLVDSRFQQSAEQPVKDLPTLHIPYTMHVTADVCLESGYATGVKNIKFTKSPAEQ